MTNWLDLFRTSGFMPHGLCIAAPGVIFQHIVGDFMVAAAYFAIPLVLFRFGRRHKFQLDTIVTWFGLFIFFCGLSHVMGIVVLYKPYYILEGWVKILTGVISVLALIKLGPQLGSFVGLTEMERQNILLAGEVAELALASRRLQEQNIVKAVRLRALARSLQEYAETFDVDIT